MPRDLPRSVSLELAVGCSPLADGQACHALAQELSLPFLGLVRPSQVRDYPVLLFADERGLSLQITGKGAPGPVRAEFATGKAGYRLEHGGGSGQLVARAIGLQKTRKPLKVLDATAGLGQDAFVLAGLGCEVVLAERSPIIHAVLRDGLERASLNTVVAPVMARMHLVLENSLEAMATLAAGMDVIYLDPMFPHRGKAALVKKEMQVFQQVVGGDEDAPALLRAALAAEPCRVVVKRPRKAPSIEGIEPTTRIEGKSSRYDIYALRALPGSS